MLNIKNFKFKKFVCVALSVTVAASAAAVSGCSGETDVEALKEEYQTEIAAEMEGCFNFFWNETETENESAYGITADRWPNGDGYGSIASVGFALTAYVIGVQYGYVTYDAAEERSLKTLQTIASLQQKDDVSYEGFLAHFIDRSDGSRYDNCEISSIDTAIMLCGALMVGEYFGGDVETAANEVYSNVNWNAFLYKKSGKTYVSMAYYPATSTLSSGCWDYYAEQLMIYILGAGSPVEEYRLDDTAYYDFTRATGSYGGDEFIYSWFGSLFTYQYSHAWIDFSNLVDKNGVNWYENSVNASLANYNYCKDLASQSATFAEGGWGLTACDAPNGYNGYLGSLPRGWTADSSYTKYEGTVAPAGAIGSVVFTPEESLKAMRYYSTLRLLNGTYGYYDSYNLDYAYFDSYVIGIDKGISLLMLANFLDGNVWEIFMQNDYVNNGLDVLGFTEA